MKVRPARVESILADGQTDGRPDTVKPTVVFRNFANSPSNAFHRYSAPEANIGVTAYNNCKLPWKQVKLRRFLVTKIHRYW